MKTLWLDLETSGLSPKKNSILQIAALIEDSDGNILEKFGAKCAPLKGRAIDTKALEVNGYTARDILGWPDQIVVLNQMMGLLKKCKKPREKYQLAGYNVGFDRGFIVDAMFQAQLDITSILSYKNFDVFPIYYGYCRAKELPAYRHRLVDACKHFHIPLNAHDAMNDIVATRELWLKLKGCWK